MVPKITSIVSENKKVLLQKGIAVAGVAAGFLLMSFAAGFGRTVAEIEVVEVDTWEEDVQG